MGTGSWVLYLFRGDGYGVVGTVPVQRKWVRGRGYCTCSEEMGTGSWVLYLLGGDGYGVVEDDPGHGLVAWRRRQRTLVHPVLAAVLCGATASDMCERMSRDITHVVTCHTRVTCHHTCGHVPHTRSRGVTHGNVPSPCAELRIIVGSLALSACSRQYCAGY